MGSPTFDNLVVVHGSQATRVNPGTYVTQATLNGESHEASPSLVMTSGIDHDLSSFNSLSSTRNTTFRQFDNSGANVRTTSISDHSFSSGHHVLVASDTTAAVSTTVTLEAGGNLSIEDQGGNTVTPTANEHVVVKRYLDEGLANTLANANHYTDGKFIPEHVFLRRDFQTSLVNLTGAIETFSTDLTSNQSRSVTFTIAMTYAAGYGPLGDFDSEVQLHSATIKTEEIKAYQAQAAHFAALGGYATPALCMSISMDSVLYMTPSTGKFTLQAVTTNASITHVAVISVVGN